MTKKKRSLRNEKLKANRASEREEQGKERLRIEDRLKYCGDWRRWSLANSFNRLAVETEEERRTRLDAFLKGWQLCLSFKLDVLTT